MNDDTLHPADDSARHPVQAPAHAPDTVYLGELTTEEAARAVRESPVILLPAGAFEQHGPGLPLATDTIRAAALAERLAQALGGRALVGPQLPVGVSPHHLSLAGTITLTTTTFATVTREYVQSLYHHGWRKILVITGHGGNNATLGTVAQDFLVTHPDLEFAWTPVTVLAPEAVAAQEKTGIRGHSGTAETAQMLHLAPHLVRTARLTPGTTAPEQLDPLARLARSVNHPSLALPYARLSPNGVLGDPRPATAEGGREILDTALARLTDFVEEWLKV